MLANVAACLALLVTQQSPVPVKVVQSGNGYQLLVQGKPFTVKGGGGDYSKEFLAKIGGNSFRTWGADNLDTQLAEAQKLGLKVCVGIWLGHKEHGFKYDDANAVSKQFDMVKGVIEKYKNNPAVLMWALGNEMEGYEQGDDPNVWMAVEDLAHLAHKLDPNHPTMTVIAEIGGKRVQSIQQMCPSIDIIGINSYGGAASLYDRYTKLGGTKPYIITEFGPRGAWETGKTAWDRPIEPTSTEKATSYQAAYEKNVVDHPGLCLGSYAFAWGDKQEATATWFGLFLHDGTKTGGVDVLQKEWTGKAPANPCPVIETFKVDGDTAADPGDTLTAKLAVSDPTGDPLKVHWALVQDNGTIGVNGDKEDVPDTVPGAVSGGSATGATVTMPKTPGFYRLFAIVKNGHDGAAVANIPLRVRGAIPKAIGGSVKLPFTVYAESGAGLPYVPSGWMGDAGNMKIDLGCTDNPHAGKTCLKWSFNADKGWGAIAWQSPEGDWGNKPGGFNLTGAKKLVIWARGADGGEEVSFALGIIKSDKPYFDTAIVHGEKYTLTSDWKRIEIPLDGKDLTRIKTGLVMTIGGQGHPVTVYLDDIRFE